MHFYEWNIGEYAKKTQHLTNEEDLAYRRALDLYYDTEQPFESGGLATLSRRLRVSEEALKTVIAEFFPDGKNKHAEEKIAAYYSYISKQSLNGKLGGRPKRTQAKPTALPKEPKPLPKEPSAKPPLTTDSLTTDSLNTKSKPLAPGDESPEAPKQKIFKPNGADQTPVIERIPLIGDVEFEIHQSSVLEWERLFPAVDVPQTLKEIRAWNLANPRNRKTPTGIMRHITQWLAKEQNKPEPSQYQRR